MKEERLCGHAALAYRPIRDAMKDPEVVAHFQADAKTIADLRRDVGDLTEELKSANLLLGDSAFYIRRMAKIVECYNHPSRIHARAMDFVKRKLFGFERVIHTTEGEA